MTLLLCSGRLNSARGLVSPGTLFHGLFSRWYFPISLCIYTTAFQGRYRNAVILLRCLRAQNAAMASFGYEYHFRDIGMDTSGYSGFIWVGYTLTRGFYVCRTEICAFRIYVLKTKSTVFFSTNTNEPFASTSRRGGFPSASDRQFLSSSAVSRMEMTLRGLGKHQKDPPGPRHSLRRTP